MVSIFDSQSWPNATDLSWARTILHESVHAYVVPVSRQNLTPDELKDLFGSAWGTIYLNQGHDYMVTHYINPIADALREYGEKSGYSHDDTFYEDMAWGGLQETETFNEFSPEVKTRILNTNAVELTGKNLDKTSGTQKGDDADC